LCCRISFRILPVSLCSELRFRRAYTSWKIIYEILHKILEKSWVFDQFLSVGLLKLHRRYQRFILSLTSLPFGILTITLCSELRFGRSCTCSKAYEILYKIRKKSWAFEHFLSVGWTDGSVGASGASHFCANTSLNVSRKSIGSTDAIIRWYHQIIRCLYTCFLLLRSPSYAHKNGTVGSSYALFSAYLNLGITFHSGFRFWWSWTLWKACGIIFMIMYHFIPFDWSKNNLFIGQVQFIPLFVPTSYFFFCHALHLWNLECLQGHAQSFWLVPWLCCVWITKIILEQMAMAAMFATNYVVKHAIQKICPNIRSHMAAEEELEVW
jgi:hypothetical protein